MRGLIEAVVGRVAEITSARDGRSTAVIAPGDDGLQAELRAACEAVKGATVAVLRPHEAKGIEFDHVVAVEPAAIVGATPSGLRGLYVALTRCTQSLSVVHHSALPLPIGVQSNSALSSASDAISKEMSSVMSSAMTSASPSEPSVDFEDFLRAAVTADRRQPMHERIRHRLLAQLWETGEPEDGSVADVIHAGDNGTLLFEVLEAETPTYSDLRAAATRITEIRFVLGRPVDQVILVCAAEPEEQWAVETVEGAFGVSVIWWEKGTWRGADVGSAIPTFPGNS